MSQNRKSVIPSEKSVITNKLISICPLEALEVLLHPCLLRGDVVLRPTLETCHTKVAHHRLLAISSLLLLDMLLVHKILLKVLETKDLLELGLKLAPPTLLLGHKVFITRVKIFTSLSFSPSITTCSCYKGKRGASSSGKDPTEAHSKEHPLHQAANRILCSNE
jgi:hypothetical protein